MRVYLVEDAQAICDRLVEMLSAVDGIEIIGKTGSVEQAVASILSERPDAVVLDMKLADGNGLSVLNAVRTQAPQVKVVVLTNHVDDYYRELCMRAGAHYFFDKTSEFARVPQVLRDLSQQKENGTQPLAG